MMPKLWLAAVLGILLGLGMTYATSAPVAHVANMQLPTQAFEGTRENTTTAIVQPAQPQSNPQLLLLSILAGIMVATPAFLIAKKRN